MGRPIEVERCFAAPVERLGMCAERAITEHDAWALGEVERQHGRIEASVRLGPVLSVERVSLTMTPVSGGCALRITLRPSLSFARQATRVRMVAELVDRIAARLEP